MLRPLPLVFLAPYGWAAFLGSWYQWRRYRKYRAWFDWKVAQSRRAVYHEPQPQKRESDHG